LRRRRSRDGAVDGVVLSRETVTEQTIHLSLATGAEMTACRSDSVSAECCHDFGRSVWNSLAAALGLLARQRWDTRSPLISDAAPHHGENREPKRCASHLIASPRPARLRIVECQLSGDLDSRCSRPGMPDRTEGRPDPFRSNGSPSSYHVFQGVGWSGDARDRVCGPTVDSRNDGAGDRKGRLVRDGRSRSAHRRARTGWPTRALPRARLLGGA
jgi:hypothetical protein